MRPSYFHNHWWTRTLNPNFESQRVLDLQDPNDPSTFPAESAEHSVGATMYTAQSPTIYTAQNTYGKPGQYSGVAEVWKKIERTEVMGFCFLTSLWMNDGTNIYFGYYCLFSGIVMDDAYCLLIVLTVGHFIVWLAFYTLYIPTQPRVLPSSFSHLECAWYSVSGLRPSVLMLWRDLILIVHGLTIPEPSSKTLFTPTQFNWT